MDQKIFVTKGWFTIIYYNRKSLFFSIIKTIYYCEPALTHVSSPGVFLCGNLFQSVLPLFCITPSVYVTPLSLPHPLYLYHTSFTVLHPLSVSHSFLYHTFCPQCYSLQTRELKDLLTEVLWSIFYLSLFLPSPYF